MKSPLKLIIISLYFHTLACNTPVTHGSPDTLKTESADTKKLEKRQQPSVDTSYEGPDLKEELKSYLKGYKDTLNIDKSFNYHGKKTRFRFMHFCTYDSALQIPVKYIEFYGLQEFTTHNFRSILTLSSGDSTILDTVITKETFKTETNEEEKLYGVLLRPTLSFSEKSLIISYSISIPLTDVGVSASLRCNYDGKLVLRKD